MGRIVATMIAIALAMASTARDAVAETCTEEVATLRAHLEVEQRRTFRWNTAWAITYGSVVVLQLGVALAEYKPSSLPITWQ